MMHEGIIVMLVDGSRENDALTSCGFGADAADDQTRYQPCLGFLLSTIQYSNRVCEDYALS